ncbi:hypothetical protein BaRGS_00012391, partial [Batillaria attramentaria]
MKTSSPAWGHYEDFVTCWGTHYKDFTTCLGDSLRRLHHLLLQTIASATLTSLIVRSIRRRATTKRRSVAVL